MVFQDHVTNCKLELLYHNYHNASCNQTWPVSDLWLLTMKSHASLVPWVHEITWEIEIISTTEMLKQKKILRKKCCISFYSWRMWHITSHALYLFTVTTMQWTENKKIKYLFLQKIDSRKRKMDSSLVNLSHQSMDIK